MRQLMAICTGIALCILISAGTGSAVPNPHPGQPGWIAGHQGQGHGNSGHGNEGGEHGHGHSKGERKSVAFSAHDRDVIHGYFREYSSDLPPGLAKRGGDLPPGLEKQLRVNGTLPPGLEKKLQPCPVRLARELPPLPSGYSRMMLGGQLLLLNRANVIVDMTFLLK
jgi:hypothetical protein